MGYGENDREDQGNMDKSAEQMQAQTQYPDN